MMAVVRAVAARALQISIVALIVTVGTDLLVRVVPGDPARTILGAKAPPEALNALRAELGLGQPVLRQVGASLVNLVHGNLGTSFAYRGEAVTTLIAPGLGVTASLALSAVVLSLLVGIPFGLGLALVRRSEVDLVGRLATTMLLTLPNFTAGLILLYYLSLKFRLGPAGGWAGSWPANFEYLWIPAVAISVYLAALIARTVRQAALDAIGQPFVEAACARGVPRYRIIWRHVLPNALLPVITLVGFNAGILVSGTVIVETVFALPGLGAELLEAMNRRDLPIVQGIALLTAASVVVFNLLADLVNIAVDPRLRKTG
jgi:peptide/nickel transport system permease protein